MSKSRESDLSGPSGEELSGSTKKLLIRQTAIPNGIHSCYPTAILNGWINQGSLTYSEAERAYTTLVDDRVDLFSRVTIRGESMLVFSANPLRLADLIRQVCNKSVELEGIMVKSLGNVGDYIRGVVLDGYSVVGGDLDHALLVVGIEADRELLRVSDPNFPNSPRYYNYRDFGKLAQTGDHIVVVK